MKSEFRGRCAQSHLLSFPINQRELEIFIVDGLVSPAFVEGKVNHGSDGSWKNTQIRQ